MVDVMAAPPAAETPTDEQLLGTLLADAKIVALYVQRAGLLNDTLLPAAIADVDKLPTRSWHDPAVVQLQTALHKTMAALAPTTLQDLKGPGAPFSNSVWFVAQSIGFMIISILMVVVAGGLTLSYNQGTALIQSMQQLQDNKAEERLSGLIREIVANALPHAQQAAIERQDTSEPDGGTITASTDAVVDAPAQPGETSENDVFWRAEPIEAVAAESYMLRLQEARALDKDIAVWVGLADRFWLANARLVTFLSPGPTYQNRMSALHGSTPQQMASQTAGSSPAVSPPIAATTRSGEKAARPDVAPASPASNTGPTDGEPVLPDEQSIAQGDKPFPTCDPKQAELIRTSFKDTEFGTTAISELMRSHLYHGVLVTCMANMNYHIFDFPVLGEVVDKLGLVVNVYGLWVLPALYGALGAALYHMRRVLNPILPNPSPLRVLYRITVSAFAGIVIAWIWAPGPQANEEFQNIGVNLFVVAFLVGYSIDVFFTLLDRLVAGVTGSIGKIGTAQTT